MWFVVDEPGWYFNAQFENAIAKIKWVLCTESKASITITSLFTSGYSHSLCAWLPTCNRRGSAVVLSSRVQKHIQSLVVRHVHQIHLLQHVHIHLHGWHAAYWFCTQQRVNEVLANTAAERGSTGWVQQQWDCFFSCRSKWACSSWMAFKVDKLVYNAYKPYLVYLNIKSMPTGNTWKFSILNLQVSLTEVTTFFPWRLRVLLKCLNIALKLKIDIVI